MGENDSRRSGPTRVATGRSRHEDARPPTGEYRRWQPPTDPRHRAPRPRSPEQTFLIAIVGIVVLFGGVAIAAATWTTRHLDSSVDRVPDVFPTGDRPAPAADGLTMLLVGRDPVEGTNEDGLADSLMLMRVTGGRTSAQAVYLPVYAQPTAGGPTLEQTFSQQGPAELIGVVEGLTGVRVDHYAEVDFAGFQTVTDAVGGVDVDIPTPYRGDGFDFPAGRQHLDGDQALAYMRDAGQGAETSSGERQRVLFTALFSSITQEGILTDLGRVTRTLDSMAEALRVDDTLGNTGLVELAVSLRGLSDFDFVTAPMAPGTIQDGRRVATFDPVRAPALWGYLRDDALAGHLDEFR